MKSMILSRHKSRNLPRVLAKVVIFIMLVALVVLLWHRHTGDQRFSNSASGSSSKSSTPAATFNKSQYSVNDPASIWVIVNKGRILPSSYVPAGLVVPSVLLRVSPGSPEMHLRSDAAGALQLLFNNANATGLHLMLASGYRPYSEQVSLYSGYVSSLGQSAADISSARPGHSEHQTGLAADLEPASRTCEVDLCFANTPEGKWLATNAYKYGFIIRYPADKTTVTGYEYEPWHVRYVGTILSEEMHAKNITTLEEFFGLASYTSYPSSSYQLVPGS